MTTRKPGAGRPKQMEHPQRVPLLLDAEQVTWLDAKRGGLSRAAFVRKLIEEKRGS